METTTYHGSTVGSSQAAGTHEPKTVCRTAARLDLPPAAAKSDSVDWSTAYAIAALEVIGRHGSVSVRAG